MTELRWTHRSQIQNTPKWIFIIMFLPDGLQMPLFTLQNTSMLKEPQSFELKGIKGSTLAWRAQKYM